ncbi:MAG: ATP-binding protein [bacterium]
MSLVTLRDIREKLSSSGIKPDDFWKTINERLETDFGFRVVSADQTASIDSTAIVLSRDMGDKTYYLVKVKKGLTVDVEELEWFFEWALQRYHYLTKCFQNNKNQLRIVFLNRFYELVEQQDFEGSPRLLVKELVKLLKDCFDFCVEGVWLLKDEESLSLYESSHVEPVELPAGVHIGNEKQLLVHDEHYFYILSTNGEKIAVIAFYTPNEQVSDELQEFFEPLIPLISSYFRKLEKWVTTARHQLYDFGRTETLSKELFQTTQGLQEVWDTLAKTVHGMFESDDCRLFLRQSERKLVLRGQYPADRQKGTEIIIGEDPLIQSVIDEEKAVLINNLPQQEENDRSARGIRSFIAVPFRYKDKVIGTINLSSETPHVYTSEDLEKLTRFADNLATVYHNTEEFANLTSYVEKLLSNLPVGVIDLRLEPAEVVLNEKARELLGFAKKVVKRDEFEERLTSEPGGRRLLELMYEPQLDSPSGPEKIELESENFYPVVVSALSTPIKNVEEELSGVLLVLTDITEQQMLNKQVSRQERLAALGELASSLAHEIKNPLTSIIGFTQLIPQRSDDIGFLKKMAKIVGQESSRLNSLVDNLLSFGKPQVGSRSLVKIGEIIDDIYILLNKRIDKQEVEFVDNVPEKIEVYGDPLKLKQIFLNLALNALDALSEGGKLEISARPAGELAIIEVSDTGSGIKKEAIDKIFNPFFTTRPEGTGLGLAITHRIVDEHDGEIRVDSAVGQGTTMKVYLPRQAPVNSKNSNEDE